MSGNLDRAVRAQLCEGTNGDRFGLPGGATPVLRAALARDLVERDPRGSILAALRLAAAFDGQLASPGLAAQIRSLLQSDAGAVAIIAASQNKENTLDATRRFVLREGRTVALHAPRLEATAPRGSVPLRSLFDLSGPRPRATRPKS